MNSAVVLLSGGLDSTTLLHHVIRNLKNIPVYAVSYNYGQKHSRELECAKWQAADSDLAEHKIIDISFLGELLKDSTALVTGGKNIPDLDELDDSEKEQPVTYVPNRNMMMLSIAAAYAEAVGAYSVFYGAHALDQYGYWDCTAEFIDKISATLALNRRNPVSIRAPFVDLSKAESLKVGLELDIDYSHTWSCYRGQEIACGTCPTCVERLNAFEENETPDPLEYKKTI